VLLHNDARLLPLDLTGVATVAVIGELARTPRYQGAGSSAVNPTRVVTGLDALLERLVGVTVAFAPGYGSAPDAPAADLVAEAVDLARGADLVLLFLGLPASYEAEGNDRTTIELPADQVALVRAVSHVNRRVVAVLSNGSAVSTAAWRDQVGAILELWLTGQAHGDSCVDLLLGDVTPSGKLPETVPVRLEDTSAFLSFPGEAGHVAHSEGFVFTGGSTHAGCRGLPLRARLYTRSTTPARSRSPTSPTRRLHGRDADQHRCPAGRRGRAGVRPRPQRGRPAPRPGAARLREGPPGPR
jgi:beta-glucosidase